MTKRVWPTPSPFKRLRSLRPIESWASFGRESSLIFSASISFDERPADTYHCFRAPHSRLRCPAITLIALCRGNQSIRKILTMAPLTPILERSSQNSWTEDPWEADTRDYSPVASLRLLNSANDLSRSVSSRTYRSYHSSDLSSAPTPSIHTLPISVRTTSERIRGRSSSSSSTASSIIDLGSDEKHVMLRLRYPGLQEYVSATSESY
jgi:hypothetical protein